MTAPVRQPCQQWRLKLAATHPADLEPDERAALEAHIATCETCAAVYATYARLDAAVQHLPAPAPLEDLPPKLLALWAEEDRQRERKRAPIPLPRKERPTRPSTIDTEPTPIFPHQLPPRRSRRLVSGLTALAAVLMIALLTAALLVSRLQPNTPANGPGPQQTTAPTVGTTQPSPEPPTATPTPAGPYPVQVFFSRHPDSDEDPSKVFPVERLSPDLGVATFALTELFKGPTQDEQDRGYYSEFVGSFGDENVCSDQSKNFTLSLDHRGDQSEPGTATVRFCRLVLIPGDFSGFRMETMVKQTLLQFSNIKEVVILTYDGHCFAELRGGDPCLQG